MAHRIETIGELGVVECEGRIVRSAAAVRLREAVTSLRNARIIALDLSEVLANAESSLCPGSLRPAAVIRNGMCALGRDESRRSFL